MTQIGSVRNIERKWYVALFFTVQKQHKTHFFNLPHILWRNPSKQNCEKKEKKNELKLCKIIS